MADLLFIWNWTDSQSPLQITAQQSEAIPSQASKSVRIHMPRHATPCHAMPCGCHAMSICPPELGQRDHTPQLHQRLCRCNSLCASHKVWHGSRKFLANINGMLFKNAVLVGRFNSFAEKVAYIHELHAHPVLTTTRRTCKSKSHGPIGSGQIEG